MATQAGLATILLAAEGGSPVDMLLKTSPGLWIWTLLIFLALLFVLGKWGWPLLIDKLDARDRSIRGAIEEARAEREEAERLLAEHRQLLDETRSKTTEMLAEAQAAAKSERQRIVDEAREESTKIVERGRQQIEQETQSALAKIRGNVAELAVEVTRKLIPRAVDPATHKQLAEDFARELERAGEDRGRPS